MLLSLFRTVLVWVISPEMVWAQRCTKIAETFVNSGSSPNHRAKDSFKSRKQSVVGKSRDISTRRGGEKDSWLWTGCRKQSKVVSEWYLSELSSQSQELIPFPHVVFAPLWQADGVAYRRIFVVFSTPKWAEIAMLFLKSKSTKFVAYLRSGLECFTDWWSTVGQYIRKSGVSGCFGKGGFLRNSSYLGKYFGSIIWIKH